MPTLGTEKWSAGPTAVVLKQTGKMTYGALWNQVWSFSGNTDRADVNQMFLQPFVAYQATRTLTVTLQSEATANWEVAEDRWTVPINFAICQVVVVGCVPRELPARVRHICRASVGRAVVEDSGRHRHSAASSAVASPQKSVAAEHHMLNRTFIAVPVRPINRQKIVE